MPSPSKKSLIIAGVAAIILLIGAALIIVAVVELTKKSKNTKDVNDPATTTSSETLTTTTIVHNPSNNGTLNIPTTLPPIICDLAFVVDSSIDFLSADGFNREIDIIKNNVSKVITNFRNVYLTAYNKYVQNEYDFYSMNNINDFQKNLDTFQPGTGSSLSLVLSKVISLNPPFCGKLSTYVFISEYNPDEIRKSISLVSKIKDKGSINFIIIGTGIKAQDLLPLEPSNIFSYDFIDCDVKEILKYIRSTETCGFLDPSICSLTTTTSTTIKSITTTQVPMLDCNIAIAVDLSSDILSPHFFKTEIEILQNNISNIIPDFHKVALVGSNKQVTIERNFGSLNSKDDFISALNFFEQRQGFNLTSVLKTLNELSVPDCEKISTYVFLSENVTDDILSSIPFAAELKNKGALNFIILGTAVRKEVLEPLNPTSIYLFDLAECDVLSLLNYFSNNMICGKHNCPPTTTSVPCVKKKECNIIIAADSSSDILKLEYFNDELNLLQYSISKVIPDFKRVTIFDYNQRANLDRYYGTINTQNDFITAIGNISQQPGFSLSSLLQKITMLASPDNFKVSAFVLISKYDKNEIQKSISYSRSINLLGSLNFIIIGTDIKEDDLKPLTYSKSTTYELSTCEDEPIAQFFSNSLTCSETCEPPPCNPNNQLCNIMFAIDTSSDKLTDNEYNQLISYLENNISSIITDYKHVGISTYNEDANINYPFGSISSLFDFKNNLNGIRRSPGWRLSRLLNDLVNNMIAQPNTKQNIFVFVTDFNQVEIDLSSHAVKNLTSIGTLNFVLVGTGAQIQQFLPLDPTSTYHLDFANCNVTELVEYFKNSLDCNSDCSTTTFLPPTTTHSEICDLYISFAIDTYGQALSWNDFNYTKTVILNNISSTITDFLQTSVFSFDDNQKNFPFNKIHNVNEFNEDVYFLKQSNTSSLSKTMQSLNNQNINSGKLSTFIFIAHDNPIEIKLSKYYAYSLKNKGTLTFVIIGTEINENDLSSLPYTNVIYWNFKTCSIQELVNSFKNSLAC